MEETVDITELLNNNVSDTVPEMTTSQQWPTHPPEVEEEKAESELNSTIHAFNASIVNSTVIENRLLSCDFTKMESLDATEQDGGSSKTGSDSGVEIFGTNNLQRVDSCNSENYGSSFNLEENIYVRSCDSSMISYCSENYDLKTSSTVLEDLLVRRGDNTSENGSESSSITGSTARLKSALNKRVNANAIRKKVAVSEPSVKNKPKPSDSPSRSRSRSSSAKTVVVRAPFLATTERASSRDNGRVTPPVRQCSSAPKVLVKNRTKLVPDSFPGGLVLDKNKTLSATNTRTPGSTPTDDGRWPSYGSRTLARNVRATSVTSDVPSVKPRVAAVAFEKCSSPFDKYATLPRRKREKSVDSTTPPFKEIKSNAGARESSLSRVVALKRHLSRESTPSKTLPPYPRKKLTPKTRIFHEISVQTTLTGYDVEDVLIADMKNQLKILPVDRKDKQVQVDSCDKEVEHLEAKIKRLHEENTALQIELIRQKEDMAETEHKLNEEREEKLAAQRELQRNTERVMVMLGSVKECGGLENNDGDSYLILESQLKVSGEIVVKQQNEIVKLHSLCKDLQQSKERYRADLRYLELQQADLEMESLELQEFLQAEKCSLVESLRETEELLQIQRTRLAKREVELERQQEECGHLVRISEQRRHENLALQARLGSLETRSRELLLHQGAAVSGAAVALSGLGSRLDGLVEQLVTSYSISQQDLEDVIYHNEVYHNSESSAEGSPKRNKPCSPLSPQKGRSFVTAIIAAIKNAAGGTGAAKSQPLVQTAVSGNNDEDSDTADLLDSETEPCLMMENVLEDVTMPDSHSHNLVSSTHSATSQNPVVQIEGESILDIESQATPRQMNEMETNDKLMMSLNNLSQAILNRQQSEAECSVAEDMSINDSTCDMPSLSEYCPTLTLVDQVIDVDNLVTKLLKVLRIVQLENESCIQELQDECNVNSNRRNDVTAERMKTDLESAASQLSMKVVELTETRTELKQHQVEVEKLTAEVRQLHSQCSQSASQLTSIEDDARLVLRQWEENGSLPDKEKLARIIATPKEIPALKDRLCEKERQLADLTRTFAVTRNVMTESWHQAVAEARRQYDAIDRALETLHSIQIVVKQCPPLAKLQQDLEETNFQTVSTLPLSMSINGAPVLEQTLADFNANGSNINSRKSDGINSQTSLSAINGTA